MAPHSGIGKNTIWPNVVKEARLLIVEGRQYRGIGPHFSGHETVNHSAGEYVRLEDRQIHTNTIFSTPQSKAARAMTGQYLRTW